MASSEKEVTVILLRAESTVSALALHESATAVCTRADFHAAEDQLRIAHARMIELRHARDASADSALDAQERIVQAETIAMVVRVDALKKMLAFAIDNSAAADRVYDYLLHVATSKRAQLKAQTVLLQHRQTLVDQQSAGSAHAADAAQEAVNQYEALVATLEAEMNAPPMIDVKDADVQRSRRAAINAAHSATVAADTQLERVLVHIANARQSLLKAHAVLLKRRQTLADLQSAGSAHADAAQEAVNQYVALVATLEADMNAPPMIDVKDADEQRSRRAVVQTAFAAAVAADRVIY